MEEDGIKAGNDIRVNVPVNVRANLTSRKWAIIELIARDECITMTQLAAVLHVNERTIQRDILSLKERGVLNRIGADKNGNRSCCVKKTTLRKSYG